jgi:RNA polymerase sigma-70 factor (ECF subfamily)
MSTYSDRELISLFRSEDGKNKHYAFRLIVDAYTARVYQLTRRMVIDHDDSNDIVQNTFIKVWHHLDQFREDSQLFTWIYRIATNECLAFLRQKRRRFFLPIADVEAELSAKLQETEAINPNKLELRLQQAILALPEKQRLVFQLRYFEGMRYEEMSEVLGTSVGALKASYHHAVKKIEHKLLNH